MSLPARLVLATANPGKVAEWRELLAGVELVVVPLPEVDEPGPSEVDNARAKAVSAAAATGQPALGDDVGLWIAALGGAPGPLLKRWAFERFGGWEGAREHCAELAGSAATYVCGLALALPDGTVLTARGAVDGTLVAPSGAGPGLEPCFLPDGADRVLGSLEGPERTRLHHRERALAALTAPAPPPR